MSANTIIYDGLTVTGRRSENQDSILILELKESNVWFFAVADGMGGVKGGSLASRLVVEAIEEVVQAEFSEKKDQVSLKDIMKEIFEKAQAAVREGVKNNPEFTGMGSTLTCLLIHNGNYVWGNVGDSRIYRISNRIFAQITDDHSALNDLAKESDQPLTEEMIRQYGNIINRCIDGGTDEPDIFPLASEYIALQPNEGFVLCSDGLLPMKSQYIEEQVLKLCLTYPGQPEKACREMVSLALDMGSSDNVSVIFVSNDLVKFFDEHDEKPSSPVDGFFHLFVTPKRKIKERIRQLILLVVLAVCLIITGATSALLLFRWSGSKDAGVNADTTKATSDSAVSELAAMAPVTPKKLNWKGFLKDSIVWNKNVTKDSIRWEPYPLKDSILGYKLIIVKEGDTAKKSISLKSETFSLDSLLKHGRNLSLNLQAISKRNQVIYPDGHQLCRLLYK